MKTMHQERITEILSFLIDGITQNISYEKVENELLAKKYKKSSIASAYSWLLEKKSFNSQFKKPVKKNVHSHRVFSPIEEEIIGVENYNKLLVLVKIGFLTSEDFDLIMDQILIFDGETLNGGDLSILMLSPLFELEKRLLPGSRSILFLSDTIN